jgi:hypothetical protein
MGGGDFEVMHARENRNKKHARFPRGIAGELQRIQSLLMPLELLDERGIDAGGVC